MKRLIGVMTIAMGLGLGMSGVSHAQAVGTGIKGSSHDFTDGKMGRRISGDLTRPGTDAPGLEAWNYRREICRVCHVPHDHGRTRYLYTVEGGTNGGLLWNHDIRPEAATYLPYSSPTMNVQMGQPTGISKLCLGCHDGTVAVDSFDEYGRDGTLAARNLAGFAGGALPGIQVSYDGGYLVGQGDDLRGTHPISIPYPAASANNFNPSSVTWIGGEQVVTTLEGGLIQCSTCHDVHSQEVATGTHLLRQYQQTAVGSLNADGRASALCLTCHIK